MLSRMQVKRAIKSGAGLAAVAAMPFVRKSAATTGCILAYHRVAQLGFVDPSLDDWNVGPGLFERQVEALVDCAEIVPLADMMARCRAPRTDGRPCVALTFDDGYSNFRTRVLPVLERYGVPATIFVVTGMIGRLTPPPFDGWSIRNGERVDPEAWRPLNWDELEECRRSGLVTIGGHSHWHLKAPDCSPDCLAEEAGRSFDILRARLGDVTDYAYPYGCSRLGHVPPSYVAAVAAAGYRRAVTYDLGRVTAQSDGFRLPRIEANGVDGPAVLRAKALGSIAPYRLTDRLRRAQRSV